jgi:hypothetical protein
MYQYQKHFTLDEARAYLPRLKYQISEILKIKIQLDKVGFNIFTRKYEMGFNPDTLSEFPTEYEQFTELNQSLADEGVYVKGFEDGLVDFPSIRNNGEEVLLCWREGEKDIAFWHTLSGGYRGRRPIAEF